MASRSRRMSVDNPKQSSQSSHSVGGDKLTDGPVVGCQLHPHSQKRLCWDVISMLFLVYIVVMVPAHLAFDTQNETTNQYAAGHVTAKFVFEALVDWFFVADLLLNFVTCVYLGDDSHLVTDYCEIAK